MRLDRLAGLALIVIGSIGLLAKTAGPKLAVELSWDESRLLDTLEERFDAAGVKVVVLEVEAGSLKVLGDSSSEAGLRAEFHGHKQETLEKLDLRHRVQGDELRIETRTGSSRGRIDLELSIPSGVELRVDDGSGSIRIAGIDGRVTIDDGSGSIAVERLGDDLRIQDGSGSIRAERVAGAVRIDDGSGSIRVADAGGSVELTDGSGSIHVESVGGDVVVRDGSGSITVKDVDGRFRLLSDGSGSVSSSNVRGGRDI